MPRARGSTRDRHPWRLVRLFGAGNSGTERGWPPSARQPTDLRPLVSRRISRRCCASPAARRTCCSRRASRRRSRALARRSSATRWPSTRAARPGRPREARRRARLGQHLLAHLISALLAGRVDQVLRGRAPTRDRVLHRATRSGCPAPRAVARGFTGDRDLGEPRRPSATALSITAPARRSCLSPPIFKKFQPTTRGKTGWRPARAPRRPAAESRARVAARLRRSPEIAFPKAARDQLAGQPPTESRVGQTYRVSRPPYPRSN